MGNPNNYSIELPTRCLALVDDLWDPVQAIDRHKVRYGGPLTTTFLLALATPVVTLPIERIGKRVFEDREGYADERFLTPEALQLAMAVFFGDVDRKAPKGLKPLPFGEAPFFDAMQGWCYAFHVEHFNLAQGLPEDIAKKLNEDDARAAAASLSVGVALLAVRNALAHGVVGYLDENGFSTYGGTTAMLAFVGEDRRKDHRGLHVLRISEAGFRSFLHRWVGWLNDVGVAQEMAAA